MSVARDTAPTARLQMSSRRSTVGVIAVGHLRLPCALGRSGVSALKREGDGASPAGRWPVRHVFYRPDRGRRPRTALPVRRLRPDDGWCDAVGDRNYNRPVRHPYPASAERLWREDHLYDVVVVLGCNDRPRRQGRGSAIFIHLARPGFPPTEGCLAFAPADLSQLLAVLRPGSAVVFG